MESLTVTTDDNLLPHIKTAVSGNRLELGSTDPIANLRPTNDIVYTLQVKQLDGLVISGSGSVAAKGLKPEQLTIEISGSGAVSARGTARDLNVTISGSGAYEGEQMKSTRATVRVTGSGGAVVAASETLIVQVTGSGRLSTSASRN